MLVSRAIWSVPCAAVLVGGCAVIPAEERHIAAAVPQEEGLAEFDHPERIAAARVDLDGRYFLIASDGVRMRPTDGQDEVSVLHPEAMDEVAREDGRATIPLRPGRERQPILPEF